MDLKLSTLDVKIWIRDGVIEYEFFEKPMSANTVLHAKTSPTQEVVRRLLHTSRRLPESTKQECLETLCQKMINSSQKPNFIKKVLIAGMTSYKAKLMKSIPPAGNPYIKPLDLGIHYNSMWRWRKKVMAKETWYKDKEPTVGDGQDEQLPEGWKYEGRRKDTNKYSHVHPINKRRITD